MQWVITSFLLRLELSSPMRLCQSVSHPHGIVKVPDSLFRQQGELSILFFKNTLKINLTTGNDQRSIADEDEVLIMEWQSSSWVCIYWKKKWFGQKGFVCVMLLIKLGILSLHLAAPPSVSMQGRQHFRVHRNMQSNFPWKNWRKLFLFSCSPPLLIRILLCSFSSISPTHNSLWPFSPSPPLPLALVLPQDLIPI